MTDVPTDALPFRHDIALRAADLDYLGHVTEVLHVAMFEEARFVLLREVMAAERPVYVVGAHALRFRREIRLHDGPVSVHLGIVQVGERGFDLVEHLVAADGTLRTSSTATLLAFDLETRRSRPLSDGEAAGARRHLLVPDR